MGISVDSVPCKTAWAEPLAIESVPLLSDFWPHGAVAERYGILRAEGFSERAVFIVDKKGTIRYIKIFPLKEQPGVSAILAEIEKLK